MRYFWFRFPGYVRVRVPREEMLTAINFLHENSIYSWGYFEAEDGFSFCISLREWKRLSATHPAWQEERRYGLVPFLLRQRHRAGLLVGGVLALLIFLWAGTMIWDVRIEGNSRLSDSRIADLLADAGLSVGTKKADFDREAFLSAVRLQSEELSYVSVNIEGNVAYVKVMERLHPDAQEEEEAPANLVASSDAVIESLSVRRGTIAAAVGQVVHKGELLVSGVTEGSEGSRFVRAAGEVYARVQRTFSVLIPQRVEKREVSTRQLREISLNFFGKQINIYRDTGNLPPVYDTIYREEPISFFGLIQLPFSIVHRECVVWESGEVPLDPAEAVALAYRRLGEVMTLELRGKELLSRSVQGSFTDEGYRLVCYAECLEDIAIPREFEIR